MTLPLPTVAAFFLAFGPSASSPPILSPYEILKLVGFATGAALHLYLCWMILRRYGIRQVERSLLGLGLSIGLWHFGNFTGTIYDMLLDYETVQEIHRGEWWLRLSDSIAYLALAFLPPTLAHAHFRVWAGMTNARRAGFSSRSSRSAICRWFRCPGCW
jgi:hypothetical protein